MFCVFVTTYDEMLRLQRLGSNTPTGVPCIEDEIMAIVRGGKQRGHIPGVGRVLPGQGTVIPLPSQSTHSADIARLKKHENLLTKQVNMFMRLFRSDNMFSQILTQLSHSLSMVVAGGVAGAGMISQEMMRTAARMRRRRTIVRGCGSPGNIAREGIPFELFRSMFPGRSPGKPIPDDKSPGILRICRWGKWQML
uniref:Uncharacterized protein n=1 Tax=Tanacetum cinerariifolium TaxID=118510 RepID=A0A699KKH7_TANCI|nr:hypothetical protein [Tanacetum cinerariifolium]